MKCGLNTYWWKYPRKLVCEGSVVMPEQIISMISKRNGQGFWKICDGDIEINVGVGYIPYFGGSDAELEVEFRCNKCGNSHYPDRNLPQSYNINEWLNKILKEIK